MAIALSLFGAANFTYPIGQSRIPFVVPSSGTMGNNGALSGITALATAYPNAYCYFPSGAISAGSAAGWYYATFSSTTAATIFNNTYSSGTPSIPASPTSFATTGPGAYTQTTSSFVAAYVLSIPGNLIGINGAIRITGVFSTNSSAGGKDVLFQYGNYNINSHTQTTNLNYGFMSGFANRGITNVQVPLNNSEASDGPDAGGTLATGSIDSTVAQNLTIYWFLATATDTVTIENIQVEFIPGVS